MVASGKHEFDVEGSCRGDVRRGNARGKRSRTGRAAPIMGVIP